MTGDGDSGSGGGLRGSNGDGFLSELRQRATALLQPADIPGLTHLQRAVVVTRIGEGFGCLFPSHSAWTEDL